VQWVLDSALTSFAFLAGSADRGVLEQTKAKLQGSHSKGCLYWWFA